MLRSLQYLLRLFISSSTASLMIFFFFVTGLRWLCETCWKSNERNDGVVDGHLNWLVALTELYTFTDWDHFSQFFCNRQAKFIKLSAKKIGIFGSSLLLASTAVIFSSNFILSGTVVSCPIEKIFHKTLFPWSAEWNIKWKQIKSGKFAWLKRPTTTKDIPSEAL